MYFRGCEYCGASLDPGEKCDCREKRAAVVIPALVRREEDGQLRFDFQKKVI